MVWAAVGAAAITVVGGYMTAKSNQKSNNALSQAAQKQDPYGPYRDAAALKLNSLMDDPSKITDTAEYKARQTAASRTMAAQGYTGSGNALAAAAEAGGNSYQQAFNNLAMLSGAGVAPGQGAVQAAMGQSQNNQNAMNTYGQLANGLVGSGIQAWNNYQANQGGIPDANNPALQPETIPSNQITYNGVVGGGAFDPSSVGGF